MANLGCSVCPTLSVAGLVEGGLVGVLFAGSHLGFHLGWDIENLRSYSPSLKPFIKTAVKENDPIAKYGGA